MHVLYCACGATRQAPTFLVHVSCVRCGAAMHSTPLARAVQPPSRRLLSLGTLVTQLLGTFLFALALVWMIKFRISDGFVVGGLVVGAAFVFAGGAAYRGSVVALGLCAALDFALALALLAPYSHLATFVAAPFARFSAKHIEIGCIFLACLAALASINCVVSIPQARDFTHWRDRFVRSL